MLKDLSFDEIQNYFDDLDNKQNPKFLKAQLYNMARREAEKIEKEKEIENTYGDNNSKHSVVGVLIIDEQLSIIKAQEKWNDEMNIMYYAVVNMKKQNYALETLHEAIIYGIAVAHKNDTYYDAVVKLLIKE